MSDIKPVIALLCKYLNILYGCNVKPEHFRLAKFNESKENVVCRFWEILYEICRNEIKQRIHDEDCVVDFVKLNFSLLKYESVDFYSLPSDMSEGSRELLMAFAWLLATKNILEIATRDKISQSSVNMEFGNFKYQVENKRCEHTRSKTLKSIINYILVIFNKIHNNIRAINELDQERTTLLCKVHAATLNVCGLPHLSVGDVKLIYDSGHLKLTIEKLKYEALLIDTHMQWNKKCHLFWQWMGTVVDEKDKSLKQPFSRKGKHTLLTYLQLLRRNVQNTMKIFQKNDLTVENCKQRVLDTSEEPFSGLPRYSLQIKETDCEVEEWQHDAEKLSEELNERCSKLLSCIHASLEERYKTMEDIVIIK